MNRNRQLDGRLVMGAIIAVSNQQRGVGKTTIIMNLGMELAARGFRILMVDNDPQADLTTSVLGVPADHIHTLGLYEGRAVEPMEVGKDLFIIGADIGLSIVEGKGYEAVFDFKNELLKMKYDFDFIFIDSLPSLGAMHAAALAASDYLLIVVRPCPLLGKGISDLMESSTRIVKRLNPGLKPLGIIINQAVKNNDSNTIIMKCLTDKYSRLLFETALSRCVDKAPDIERYKAFPGPGSALQSPIINDELLRLTDEILRRVERI